MNLDSFPFHESEYLAAFRTECRQDSDLRLTVRTVPELPLPEDAFSVPGETVRRDSLGRKIRLCKADGREVLLYRVTERSRRELFAELREEYAPNLGSSLLLRWLDLPAAFLERGAVFLHASFVRRQGEALLFTGPKQIGKSTQAELWRRHRGAEVLNGDRALLRQIDGRWMAFGSPFCGTSGICVNAAAPLRAVTVLAQGPENRVERVDARQACAAMLSGCSYDPASRRAVEQVLNLAEALWSSVPFYVLRCRPEEGAVACLEAALQKEEEAHAR